MAVTQYIGARYVPVLADPVEWSIANDYEPLTIVLHQGNSYTSRQFVPAGINIANTEFWALTGNYNAQIEQYRAEVQTFDSRITENTTANATQTAQLAGTSNSGLKGLIDTNTGNIATNAADIGDLDTSLTALEGTTQSYMTATDAKLAGTETSGLKTLINANSNAIADLQDATMTRDMVIIGDSFTSSYYVQDSALWYHAVADFLGCTPHNYSQRGAGYLRASTVDSSTFMTLLQQAAADSSFDNGNVKWVFVYGGLNDIDHADADSAFSTHFTNFCNAVVSNFPNAQLVVCGINSWQSGFSLYHTGNNWRGQIFYEQTMKSQTGFRNARGIFVSMCGALGFNSSWYNSDNSHPNAEGHKMLATWILSAMFGSGLMHSVSTNFSIYESSDAGAGSLVLHLAPGFIEFRGNTVAAQADSYVLDGLNFVKDQGVDLRGVVLCGQRAGANVFGWFGVKNDAGYVNTTENGFFNGTRRF